MSGLEVAGVVLGALPLVISALEHYAKGVEGIIRYYKYRIHLQTLIDAIKTQKVIFSDTLEQLLTGIVRIDKMAAFIADPAAQPEVDVHLKKRLRNSYSVYFANVRGMEAALATMMMKLKLGIDGKVRWVSLASCHILRRGARNCRRHSTHKNDSPNSPTQAFSNKSIVDSNSVSARVPTMISCVSSGATMTVCPN